MTVRAKFYVTDVEKLGNDGYRVCLLPVAGGSDENDSFFNYTPGGVLDLQVVSESIAEKFKVGEEYYLDITKASSAP